MTQDASVRAWTEQVVIPTYLPAAPEVCPMFLDRRVYQGSSGRIYPLPFTDRIAESKTDRAWQVVWLENEYLQVMILPELGGRIHALLDKTNGYDLIYRQSVIKPALVGLAGPWISGGIEFNWPQHHRPATFLPAEWRLDEHPDGSVTVWLSDHDPLTRMKGMHGACLHPGRAYLELKVRAHNRTPMVQTFLWWANVATRVHEGYQSFFPPDARYVADHAKRAVSTYPLCRGRYYGVDYQTRAKRGVPRDELPTRFVPPHCGGKAPLDYAPNDLSWYANIPTPCSYMCLGTQEDFFGGYDHFKQAGLVHIADHHIAPGKKQWTWGNHEFGYAWDRNLTDTDGPYIELMAGVFTDNQPDFSFLQPGETKSWSQFWYPIQQIGPAQHANLDAALSLRVTEQGVRAGVSVSRPFPGATLVLRQGGKTLESWRELDLAPGKPFVAEWRAAAGKRPPKRTGLSLLDAEGREIVAYTPGEPGGGPPPSPAEEPPPPEAVASADELYLIGLHLDQYRHATRCPSLYWQEALSRDPGDSRCNHAMGWFWLRRGQFLLAELSFYASLGRLTQRNPNPRDGEPHYSLGLAIRHRLDMEEGMYPHSVENAFQAAYDAFSKATWNQAWAGAAHHALAELDCRRQRWHKAETHLQQALRYDADHLGARNLLTLVLRQLGRAGESDRLLNETRALDPLDLWSRDLAGETLNVDAQARLDLAHDYARAGFHGEAIRVLEAATFPKRDLPDQSLGAAPMVAYTIGWCHARQGDQRTASQWYRTGSQRAPDYCFPARLEEIGILEAAAMAHRKDARPRYYLGNLLYARGSHPQAIQEWEHSLERDPDHALAWRNLGMAYFNCSQDTQRAHAAYERAVAAAPANARLLYERDQLWKRLGVAPSQRLAELTQKLELVRQRDDLSLELCALYNQTGRHTEAMALLGSRRFQPWEGGEGVALGQHVRTHLALGRAALARQDGAEARALFEAALHSPPHLGEARHLLANASDIHYWLGEAGAALGRKSEARQYWQRAAEARGDFQEMSIRSFSEMTYYSALALCRLGQNREAQVLLEALLQHALELEKAPATVDYFATSLPTMLLFEEDLPARQTTAALFLQAQARLGLGQTKAATRLLKLVLEREPHHAPAADLIAELGRTP